jgi:hypothetical protein
VEREPAYTFRSGATWASGSVTYLGSVVEPAQPRAGDQVTLRHYFRSGDRAPRGYRFFIHVVDPGLDKQVGNLDHELQQGAAPLGTWPPGKIIEDVHAFQMPAYPGALQLRLGFWDERGRLPVDEPLRSDGSNRLLGPSFAAPAEEPLPEYQVPRAARPPTIDGRLDDEAWKAAPAVTLGSSMDGSPTVRKTVLRMLYDDAHLYVSFDAEDPDVWGTFRKKDDPIYNEDACEVFIDADGDGATYNELQVSPHNVNFDASFVTRRSDLAEAMRWESGMETAEMKIPLKNLNHVPRLPPRPGDVWRFNAYRLEHLQRRTRIEGQSFSPLHVGDFHYLPRFGRLVFR